MMLSLDFAVACVDWTGLHRWKPKKKKKNHGNRFNNNIDREYLSVNNNTVGIDVPIQLNVVRNHELLAQILQFN